MSTHTVLMQTSMEYRTICRKITELENKKELSEAEEIQLSELKERKKDFTDSIEFGE